MKEFIVAKKKVSPHHLPPKKNQKSHQITYL